MLLDKIDADLRSSLKGKNAAKVSVLRMLKSAIKNKSIEKKIESLSDDAILDLIQKQIKQTKDSIDQFKKGNRQDLVDKESQEFVILQSYLPAQISDTELKSIIQQAITSTGAQEKSDMGKIMQEVMPKIKGRADGKLVNQMVLSLLK